MVMDVEESYDVIMMAADDNWWRLMVDDSEDDDDDDDMHSRCDIQPWARVVRPYCSA